MARAKKPAAAPRSRSRKGRGKLSWLGIAFAALAFLGGGGWYYSRSPEASFPLRDWISPPSATAVVAGYEAPAYLVGSVEKVTDGDTIHVSIAGTREKVRLLNVNTPESVHSDASRNTEMGKVAADYLRRRLDGAQVRLELPGGTKDRDNFGRLLATVFLDGENINVELVREGLSEYYTKYGKSARYDGDFKAAEKDAKAAARGVWGQSVAP